jgi:hypothetical protein
MDNSLAVVGDQNQLAPADVVAQVRLVQEVMKSVMRDGEHYGKIPGTAKPTLYKAGAEKLSLTFRFAADFEVETINLALSGEAPMGHREVRVLCKLTHIPTGKFWGSGVGSCSTMESKYRYREGVEVVKETDGSPRMVPGKYWAEKDPSQRDASLLGGKGYRPKKIDGEWFVVKDSGEKVEYPDPADYYNTILKMAKKRAHVDAVISATAASDILTQDLEDLPGMPPPRPTEPAKSMETYEEVQGVLVDASHRPSTNKNGVQTGGTTFYGKIGSITLWTKDNDIGQELLEANGLPVIVSFLRGKMLHQVKKIEISKHSNLDEEPDDLDMTSTSIDNASGEPSQESNAAKPVDLRH